MSFTKRRGEILSSDQGLIEQHSEDDIVIRFDGVTKNLGDNCVLKDVTCNIHRNKITVIVGPSGVGKSVFIKHLIGLLKPDAGRIFVDDIEVNKLKAGGLYALRMRFGMMFQDGALFDSMSVGENVAFPLVQHTSMKAGERKAVVAEKLAAVGLPGIEGMFPSELSGGMRKRVGFARAIVMEPEIVLFDEPNSGLDPVMADAIDSLILEMQRELGITFLVISHDIPSTRRIADYVGMLFDSRLIAFGEKSEVMESTDPILKQFFSRSAEGPIRVV